ncbi:MAG: hypothetical protein Ct9H300mP25_09490 [Acidobacteriota bacterium]|nr:MAG: hypothetical protein Ct9H300mP25_09490 [Acidobacteriota bacterium]
MSGATDARYRVSTGLAQLERTEPKRCVQPNGLGLKLVPGKGKNPIWFQEYIARSTPAVFDGRVFANGRIGENASKREIVTCWNAEDGTKLWEHTFSVLNTTVPFNRVGWGSVTGDPETGYLYALNVDGHLHCFDRDGNIVWDWRLSEDLGRAPATAVEPQHQLLMKTD